MGFAHYGRGGGSFERGDDAREEPVNDVFGKRGAHRVAVRRLVGDTLAERARRLAPSGEPFGFGLAVSAAIHLIVGLLFILEVGGARPKFGPEIVYSVTLEGGKTIGGVSQVASKEASTVAPPKNVSAPEPETKPVSSADVVRIKEESVKEKPEKKAPAKIADAKKPEAKTKPDVKKVVAKPKPAEPSRADIDKDYQKAMQRYLGESTEAGGKGFGAAKLGGSGMGGGVLRPPEFFTYRQTLRDSIKRGWKWYDTRAALVTQVTFEIGVDGVISNVEVAGSSGNDEFDQSVLRAVYKASPLPPPPPTVYNDFRSVRLSFDPRE
jgi:TonB family protein